MARREQAILTRTEQRQVVATAWLYQYGIDRADLNIASTTNVSYFRCGDVVFAIRLKDWQRLETSND